MEHVSRPFGNKSCLLFWVPEKDTGGQKAMVSSVSDFPERSALLFWRIIKTIPFYEAADFFFFMRLCITFAEENCPVSRLKCSSYSKIKIFLMLLIDLKIAGSIRRAPFLIISIIERWASNSDDSFTVLLTAWCLEAKILILRIMTSLTVSWLVTLSCL